MKTSPQKKPPKQPKTTNDLGGSADPINSRIQSLNRSEPLIMHIDTRRALMRQTKVFLIEPGDRQSRHSVCSFPLLKEELIC